MAAWQYIKESMLLDSDGRAILEKYRCPRCEQLLRNAVQPSCGHWLCEEPCARELFNTSSPPTCPRSDCMEELTADAGMEYFPDRFVRKEIHNLEVRCYFHDKGCSWRGKLKVLEDHFKQCQFSTEECEFCGQAIHLLEMSTHMATCPKAGKLCSLADLGCTAVRMTATQLEQHCSEQRTEHFKLLVTAVTALQEAVKQHRPVDMDNPGEEEEDEGRGYNYDSGYRSSRGDLVERDGITAVQRKQAIGKEDPRFRTLGFRAEIRSPHAEDRLSTALETSRDQILQEVLPQLKAREEEVSALRGSVTKLEKQLRAKTAELEDRDFRLSLIENSSFDGTMVWKIPQFEQRMSDAKSGKYTSIFSLPFYTGRYGYKMCLRLYILGDGAGKNTHMSLFFVIMQNEFDNVLQWPFTHRVTFKLINQRGGRDIIDTFQPDPTSSSFRKPKSDMNIASGCPKFVSHQELKNEFIVDDTIFIKCSVDLSTIRAI